jgi:hypothetical protein
MDKGSFSINGKGTADTPNGKLTLTGSYKSSYQGTDRER